MGKWLTWQTVQLQREEAQLVSGIAASLRAAEVTKTGRRASAVEGRAHQITPALEKKTAERTRSDLPLQYVGSAACPVPLGEVQHHAGALPAAHQYVDVGDPLHHHVTGAGLQRHPGELGEGRQLRRGTDIADLLVGAVDQGLLLKGDPDEAKVPDGGPLPQGRPYVAVAIAIAALRENFAVLAAAAVQCVTVAARSVTSVVLVIAIARGVAPVTGAVRARVALRCPNPRRAATPLLIAVLRRPNPPGRTKTKETEMVMTGRRYRAGHRPKDIPPTEPLHETEIPNGRPKIKPGRTTNGPKTRPTKTPETLMKPRKAIAYERAARHSRPTAAAAATNLLPRLTKRLRATAEVAALLLQQRIPMTRPRAATL